MYNIIFAQNKISIIAAEIYYFNIMKKIIIENCEILTPFGNLSETMKSLYAQKSAVVSRNFYDCPVSLAKMPKTLTPKEIVGAYSIRPFYRNNEKTLFIYSVAKGDINKIIDKNYNGYSPILDEQAKQVAEDLWLGLACKGERFFAPTVMVSSNACAAGAAAIDTARLFLQNGEFERVIIFGFEQISEFVVKGFFSLGAISPTGAKPFDKTRDGMSLGEGSGICVLRTGEAKSGDICVLGSGSSNDANHRTAPARDGAGLALAIERALKSAKIAANEISAIKCHGTATPYNDAMEAKAMAKIFGNKIPPMVSTKGALGHLSGAGSMIETIISAEFLKEGVIPATIGFNEFECEEKIGISCENQKFDGNKILCLSCGFGGMNTAVVLEK
jgi:3-oxoacyl-[acyl-carrier-protein] synthase-1